MSGSRYNLFFFVRLLLLIGLLVAAVVTYKYVQRLGGPTQIIPELLRAQQDLEDRSDAELELRIANAVIALQSRSLDGRITAARDLAEIGRARKKSFHTSGLSVDYGLTGAQVRIANTDNSDLRKATRGLIEALRDKSERLRLEASYALSHIGLGEQQAPYTADLHRALDREFSIAIKTYLARALGDIGPGAAGAKNSLSALLVEDDPLLVAAAAQALARIGPKAYTLAMESHLLGLVTSDSARVREHAAEALGAIGAFSSVTERALRDRLDDKDAYVRIAAALSLAEIGLTDDAVLAKMQKGFKLSPRTTIYVEDVARVAAIREKISKHVTELDRTPDELVPALVKIATESPGDIFKKEKAIAMIADTDGFDESRAKILIDLLQNRRVHIYYAVVEGLVTMGEPVVPLVEPLLQQKDATVRDLAKEIMRRIRTVEEEVDAAALIAAYEQAEDIHARSAALATLQRSYSPEVFDYLVLHQDDRVYGKPIAAQVTNWLLVELRRHKSIKPYQFRQQKIKDRRHLILNTLQGLGILSADERTSFLADIESRDLGDRVQALFDSRQKRPPESPRIEDELAQLYADLPAPRHKKVARSAKGLLERNPKTRIVALNDLKRVATQAVEAPMFIQRAMLDPKEKVRTKAVVVFIDTGITNVDAIKSLENVLFRTDQSDYLNSLAARGLAQIGAPALDTLSRATAHKDTGVRLAATYGLLLLGTDAASARPLLERLAEDSHKGVKTYAGKALAKLEHPP